MYIILVSMCVRLVYVYIVYGKLRTHIRAKYTDTERRARDRHLAWYKYRIKWTQKKNNAVGRRIHKNKKRKVKDNIF